MAFRFSGESARVIPAAHSFWFSLIFSPAASITSCSVVALEALISLGSISVFAIKSGVSVILKIPLSSALFVSTRSWPLSFSSSIIFLGIAIIIFLSSCLRRVIPTSILPIDVGGIVTL